MDILKGLFSKNKPQEKLENSEEDDFFNLGMKYYNQGNFELSIEQCTKTIQIKPNLAMGYNIRGSCYLILEKYELALADFNKALQLNPNLIAVCYYNRGLCYSELKKYELALTDYDKAIELNPQLAQAYGNRGNCCYNLKKYELALTDYNKVIELNPSDATAYNNRGHCYLDLKNYKLALADCNKAIELNPQFSDAYFNRGNCYYNLEKYELTLADYNKTIELNPQFSGAYYNRACLCFYILNKYEIVLADFNKSIELNPQFSEAYNQRGICYADQENYELALNDFDHAIKYFESAEDKKNCCFLASNVAVTAKQYDRAKVYIKQAFDNDPKAQEHEASYLESIESAEELDRKNKVLEEINTHLKEAQEQLEEKIKELEAEKLKKESAQKEAREKEKEMLSFFTHTMRNALATAPESLRQAIRLLGSEDYEKNQKHYEAINEITALFSTITLTDCLIDTFKQSIYDTEEFKRAWQQDNTGDATPEWFIAAALRQSLNRIIFMEDATGLRKLINNQGELIKPTRKAFIEQVLPLDTNQHDVEKFYHWLQSITALEVNLEKSTVQFGANQIKFSLMFAISSELILNALKYWSGTGKIQIAWHIEPEHYIFSVKNACKANASSQLAGTHKGLAFINRLIELLGEQAQFNCTANEYTFTAELKLHKTLLEGE